MSGDLREAAKDVATWLRGALDCKVWHWDADQKEAAEDAYKAFEAALRSAARTGPDVAWFEACRGTLKQTSVSTVATTIYCRGIGEIPSIVLDDESIDRIIAALPAPAGESVTGADLQTWLNGQPYKSSTLAEKLLSTFNITRKSEARS